MPFHCHQRKLQFGKLRERKFFDLQKLLNNVYPVLHGVVVDAERSFKGYWPNRTNQEAFFR